MIRVTLTTDSKSTIIHSPSAEGAKLTKLTSSYEVGRISTSTIAMMPDNPGYNIIKPYKTLIEIYNTNLRQSEFFGRILPDTANYSNGIAEKTFKAADALDLLNDSYPNEEKMFGSFKEVVEKILKFHNPVIEPFKQFGLGEISNDVASKEKIIKSTDTDTKINTVLEPGDPATIKNSAIYYNKVHHSNTKIAGFAKERLSEVKEVDTTNNCYYIWYEGVPVGWVDAVNIYQTNSVVKTTETTKTIYEPLKVTFDAKFEESTYKNLERLCVQVGCEMYYTRIDGVNFINFAKKIGGKQSSTPIRVTDNMIDISKNVSVGGLYTRVVPIGVVKGTVSNDTKTETSSSSVKTIGGTITQAARDYVGTKTISMIGDSLGVGTETYLRNLSGTLSADNKGSRRLVYTPDASLDATKALKTMIANGQLASFLVVIIGTNAGLDQSEVDNFVRLVPTSTKILWVNTASEVAHKESVASVIKATSDKYSNVYNLDWKTHCASAFTTYYPGDGDGRRIHMSALGYQKHAEFIAQAIYQAK